MEKHDLKDKEEPPKKFAAVEEEEEEEEEVVLEQPANEEYIIVAHFKPYSHTCPVDDYNHDCDPEAEDENDRCCRPNENECNCEDIEFCVNYYQIPKSELGKKGTPFESCAHSKDVQQLFLDEKALNRIGLFGDYLVFDGDRLGPNVPVVLSQGRWEIVSI